MIPIMLSMLVLVMPLLLLVFAKWILAAFSILTGDKESLREFGNLCEKDSFFQWNQKDWRGRSPEEDWRNRGEGNML